jgi:hypothetical protein
VAGVSRAYARPAHQEEEQEQDTAQPGADISLEELMAQMKTI